MRSNPALGVVLPPNGAASWCVRQKEINNVPYDSLWNHLCGWIRCLACPLVRECQSAAGNVAQVSGRVTDGSGAAVPGVAIKLLETQRNIAHTATTDEQGLYVLPGLPVGPYQLEVKKIGRAHV